MGSPIERGKVRSLGMDLGVSCIRFALSCMHTSVTVFVREGSGLGLKVESKGSQRGLVRLTEEGRGRNEIKGIRPQQPKRPSGCFQTLRRSQMA